MLPRGRLGQGPWEAGQNQARTHPCGLSWQAERPIRLAVGSGSLSLREAESEVPAPEAASRDAPSAVGTPRVGVTAGPHSRGTDLTACLSG